MRARAASAAPAQVLHSLLHTPHTQLPQCCCSAQAGSGLSRKLSRCYEGLHRRTIVQMAAKSSRMLTWHFLNTVAALTDALPTPMGGDEFTATVLMLV